jgi:adenylate kinase family enzyme
MQRILIIGPGGAGKSTLARALAAKLNLPVIHLDQHQWLPGWVNMDKGLWHTTVRELTARESWVMDGNYADSLDVRLPRADLVIVLEASRFKCIWRAFTRVLRSCGRTRPDMAAGCPERFNLEFFVWLWNFPRDTQPGLDAVVAAHAAPDKIVRLRSESAVADFLSGIQPRH